MSWYEWAGIGAAVYAVVGLVTWALMKAASDADDIMESWHEKEGSCVHDD